MKIKYISTVLCITFFISSCISISYPATHDKSFPPYGRYRYRILGPVSTEGNFICILAFGFGGAGYEDLKKDAYEIYGIWKVDDVINVSVDRKIIFVFGLFTMVKTTLHGTAIQYISAFDIDVSELE